MDRRGLVKGLSMHIATILPTAHIWLEDGSDYHLCLAHQIQKDLTYTFFFRKQVRENRYVILDNGAAEHGVPMKIDQLLMCAEMLECQEMVLPDTIFDAKATLRSSSDALDAVRASGRNIKTMLVPHGKSKEEWISCAKEMLSWGDTMSTIGISKFIVPGVFPSRIIALASLPDLIYKSNTEIHLLGYTGVANEIQDIEKLFPRRIRGIDSSLPTLYAQMHQEMKQLSRQERSKRPGAVDLDLDAKLDEGLLKDNIRIWKEIIWT